MGNKHSPWHTSKGPCSDSKCLEPVPGDEYEFQESAGVPETPVVQDGLGAAVISSGTLTTPEETKTAYKTQVKPRTGRRAFRNNRTGDGKQRTLPRVRGCGHKLDMKHQPHHLNCKPCWTAFFRNQDEMSENIAKILVEQGQEKIAETFGRKFLTRFHEYCKLVERMEALRLAYQEEQNVGIELAAPSDEDTVQSVGGDAKASIEVG